MNYNVRLDTFLQHVFANSKPKLSFLSNSKEEEEERQERQEEKGKELKVFPEDNWFLYWTSSLNFSMSTIISFLEGQEEDFCSTKEIETRKKFILSLLKQPFTKEEKRHFKQNKSKYRDKDIIYLQRLYQHNIRFSDFQIFFPPYDWSSYLEERKKEYEEKQERIQEIEEKFHSFVSEIKNNKKNTEFKPWYHTVPKLTIPTIFAPDLSELFIPEISFIIHEYFQTEITETVKGPFVKEHISLPFYHMNWLSNWNQDKLWYSILLYNEKDSRKSPAFNLFNMFKSYIVNKENKEEIGGETICNELTQLLLQDLTVSESYYSISWPKPYVLYLLVLLTSNCYNVDNKKLILDLSKKNKYKPKGKYTFERPEIRNIHLTSNTIIPWFDKVEDEEEEEKELLLTSNRIVKEEYIYQKKIVKWDETNNYYYRVDVKEASKKKGEQEYYWSLTFHKYTFLLEAENHPLRFVRYGNYEAEEKYMQTGTVLAKNSISSLCLELLTLSNEELHKRMKIDNIAWYRQIILLYFCTVSD